MAAKLPLEILEYIAKYVKVYDWCKYVLVCKQWTESFLNAYWAQGLLKRLNIFAVFKPISEKDIEAIRNAEPAHTVTEIDFCSHYTDTSWIFYFAHKYPSPVNSNSEIQSPEYQHSTHLPHPLQTLEIAKTRIDIHVFKYISFRCRQLKYMTLLFISYRGSDIDKTRQILVDMPFSQLKLLKAYGNQKSYSLSPNLIVIEQMGNDETDQGHAPQLNWYHLCVDTTNRRNILLVWELGRCDIEFCQRYLKDFGRRREFEEERNDTEEYDFSYKLKRFWKRDLQLGVLILRFKSQHVSDQSQAPLKSHPPGRARGQQESTRSPPSGSSQRPNGDHLQALGHMGRGGEVLRTRTLCSSRNSYGIV
ncbi:hypothetical protein F4703DRAFT_1933183 [Phycomyces blakesleeanus]